MKKSSARLSLALVFSILIILIAITGCKKSKKIKYLYGIFPDSTYVLTDINSSYDDINSDLYLINGYKSLIFSSNRNSSGGQFDFVQGSVSYMWDQTNGNFTLESMITEDAFLTKLLTAANSANNEYGPFSLYSPTDGYEYLFFASENGSGNLDFYYTKNRSVQSSTLPDVLGPYPATLLNTTGDDAYISFDANQDTLYFSSSAGGNFDIYQKSRALDTALSVWLSKPFRPLVKVDSINSSSDDKCPYVFKKIMVFASNRSGGMGGYDLYYSLFKKGKWNTPVNFGPDVNTQYNEYRPVIGANNSFYNVYMIFSSDRPGGKGGYDLYLKGI
jgi:WD40-like Beta Propeller Repeat.